MSAAGHAKPKQPTSQPPALTSAARREGRLREKLVSNVEALDLVNASWEVKKARAKERKKGQQSWGERLTLAAKARLAAARDREVQVKEFLDALSKEGVDERKLRRRIAEKPDIASKLTDVHYLMLANQRPTSLYEACEIFAFVHETPSVKQPRFSDEEITFIVEACSASQRKAEPPAAGSSTSTKRPKLQ